MPQLNYSQRARADLIRLHGFLTDNGYTGAQQTIEMIVTALNTLATMPLIGRIVMDADNLREFMIDFGSSGYITLYRYIPEKDLVHILVIKHQREDGYV